MGIGLVPSNNSPVIFARSYRINDDSVSVGSIRSISLMALVFLMYSTCPPTSTPIRRFFPVVIAAMDTSKMKASSDRIGVGWSRCVQNPSDKISVGGATWSGNRPFAPEAACLLYRSPIPHFWSYFLLQLFTPSSTACPLVAAEVEMGFLRR